MGVKEHRSSDFLNFKGVCKLGSIVSKDVGYLIFFSSASFIIERSAR